MVAGQTTWSSMGLEAKDMTPQLIPQDDYEVVLKTDKMEVRKSQGDDKEGPEEKVPYAGGAYFEVPSATNAAGQPLRVWKNFFLTTATDKNGGPSMIEKADGLLGLLRALGQDIEGVSVLQNEVNGKEYLDPKAVIEFLQSLDGTSVGAHIFTEKGSRGYSDKNAIKRFFAVGGSAAPENGVEEEAAQEPIVPAPRKPVAKVAAKPAPAKTNGHKAPAKKR